MRLIVDIRDVYTIDYAAAKATGFFSELVVLMNFGAINKVEVLTCFDCGHASIDEDDFLKVNVNPEYEGDLACKECLTPPEKVKLMTRP